MIENNPAPGSSMIQYEPSKDPQVIDQLIQMFLNDSGDFFKEIDLDAVCTNRSPLYKKKLHNPLNIERESSFYTHISTNVLTVNTNAIIDSFLSDSDSAFEQIDLNTICLNHAPHDKKG